MKWILLLLLTSGASAQEFYMSDTGRICSYVEGSVIAKAEGRPMLILIKQKVCPPCVVARDVLKQLQRDKLLRNYVIVEVMNTEPKSKELMVGITTPQMFLLDGPRKHRLLRYDRVTILEAVGSFVSR